MTDALIEKQGDVSRVLDEKGRDMKVTEERQPLATLAPVFSETASDRIASETSSPPSRTRTPPSIGSIDRSIVPASFTSASVSPRSVALRIARSVNARYVAPESRNDTPNAAARFLAAVLFPDPAGPSIVIIMPHSLPDPPPFVKIQFGVAKSFLA